MPSLSDLARPLLIAAALLIAAETPPAAAGTAPHGVLVIAPDRGFLGNEETREAFAGLDAPNKALVFITDYRSRTYFDAALDDLLSAGAGELAVLPFFLSEYRPGWRLATRWLDQGQCRQRVACRIQLPFGRSYFAAEALTRALEPLAGTAGSAG